VFNINHNNNISAELKLNPSNILKYIQNFFREKFSKPITNWIIKSSAIKILKKIGEGGSSDIFLGLYRGTQIAEKRLHLINVEKNINEFKREVASFILLHHPYLLLFFGVIAEPKHLSIITEYCPGGNLHELLYNKKYIDLSWKLRKQFLLQIAIGMNFLHTNNPPILHRDLKSLNIFLTNDMKKSTDITDVKIADFGLSVRYEKNCNLTERVGTCLWMAPEVIKTQKYTTKADVYSYGIIMWEVCTREIPYDYCSYENILYRVSYKKERPNLSRLPNDTPKEFEELMQKCWEHDPNLRPDFDAIIEIIKDVDI
jgi:serine/threonine protein kinase